MEKITYPAEWFDQLVSDCRAIIERAKIETGIRLLRAKWELGNRILPDYQKFGRAEYDGKTQEELARILGLGHQRRVGELIQFRLRVGENFDLWYKSSDASLLSWRKIVHEWLPSNRKLFTFTTPSLPSGSFGVIYADPPWKYDVDFLECSPNKHYPTMTVEEICNIDVPSSDNAVLFLWATNPMLVNALKVMESWGFKYKTNMVWVKSKFGTGFYFRGQHELLLIGVKGDVHPPEESCRPPSVLFADTERHSEKPEEVYHLIEEMYPSRRYLELFARKKRKDWETWGNEV